MRRVRRARGSLTGALVLLALLTGFAWAQERAPVLIDLPTEGPEYHFRGWLQSALDDERLTVRWADLDEEGPPEEEVACLVTWSRPDRSADSAKYLRAQVRNGRGMVYVIGAGEEHVRQARTIWGPLDVNIRPQDRGASDARWASHPLTEDGPSIGAVSAGSSVSGTGGSPLIRAGGATIAMAFDWGPLGRAVLLDQSVLFDQLHEASPRPGVRDFLVRSVAWAAYLDEMEPTAPPDRPPVPPVEEPTGVTPVDPPDWDRTIVVLPEDVDHWEHIHPLVMSELERRELNIRVPRVHEGDPVFTTERLRRVGLLVFGPEREEVHWTESIAIARYFQQGGRILCIPHARRGTQRRMVGLNQLLSHLRITAALGRGAGHARLEEHPITERVSFPDDLRVTGGIHVWAPLTAPLVTVDRRPLAAAWQQGEGRIVLIDGELLRLKGDRDRPHRDVATFLRRSLDWLLGDL